MATIAIFTVLLIWNSIYSEEISLTKSSKLLMLVKSIFYIFFTCVIIGIIYMFWTMTNKYLAILNIRYKLNIKLLRVVLASIFVPVIINGIMSIYCQLEWVYRLYSEEDCSKFNYFILML